MSGSEGRGPLLSGRTVAVTGAAGFIGSFTTAALVDAGARVIALDDRPGSRLDLAGLTRRGAVEFVPTATRWPYADLGEGAGGTGTGGPGRSHTGPAWLAAIGRADSVVHLGYAEPPAGDPVTEYRRELVDNVVPSLDLLGRLAPGVTTVCVASSSLVYGRSYDRPVAESDSARPDSPYGRAKLDLEDGLAWWAAGAAGRKAVACRIATVFGPTETVPRAAPNFIRRTLAGLPPRVAVADDRRDYVYVADVAAAIVALLAAPGAGWSAVNIGTGVATSSLDLARLVVELVGADLQPEVAVPDRRPVSVVVDPGVLTATTGFTASTRLREGIAREVEWFRHHPERWAEPVPNLTEIS